MRLLSRRTIAGYAVAVIAGALSALPAEPAVKSSSPAGFAIENTEIVPVDAAAAWRALVEDVDRWWPRDHTWWGPESKLSIEPRAGGCFCEIAGPRQARHMEVVFVDPSVALRMTGGLGPLQAMGLHGALEWHFEKAESGTRITLRYQAGGYTPDDLAKFAPVVDRVQGLQLGGLANYLRSQSKKPPPGE